jgi:ATP-dependent Lhr-like helicase
MHPELSALRSPILDWFTAQGRTPFPFQHEVWDTYLAGESGLIYAPTGTGKTYAAWLGPLMEWVAENPGDNSYAARPRRHTPPLTVLWITPLRALAADTENALRAPLEALNLPWSLETRTGDTSATVRSRQSKRLPTALITTPESLSLLLTRENAHDLFADLRLVVVDEWHELMSTKRGVQVELALARLRHWRPELRTWGLSATIGNIDTAMQVLLGVANWETGEIPHGRLVSATIPKIVRIDSIIPPQMERFPWVGHLGLKLLPQVIEAIAANRSTLVFTNTRSQTEIWYQAILNVRPDWAGEIALHHGSLDRKVRDWVEDALRAGRLRCVVSTSSLDLGVDFSPVDRVLQIGSPKSVARLLQRAGRSGHQPGAESRVTCVPTHAFELIEVAAVRDAVEYRHIEERPLMDCPLDVLLQHLVTIALGGGFVAGELLCEVRTTYTFRNLSDEQWAWVLDFTRGGGPALQAYPQYHRIVEQNGRYIVDSKDVARMHRLSIGTIVSDASLNVQYLKGGKIGQVEESFVSRLRAGDKFTLAGKLLEFVRLRDMTVWVRRAKNSRGIVPRWFGGRLPLSQELAKAMQYVLAQAVCGLYESPEMQAVRPILGLQAKWSAIPTGEKLLIERVQTREGHHLFFYPFEGRLVHEGLAALFAYRLSRIQPLTFTFSANDYGFELLSPDPIPLPGTIEIDLFSPVNLLEDILASLNASEMAKRQFREIARIAGLVFQRFPGGQMTSKQLQVSTGLIYDVLTKYDAGNRLLEQAQHEVLERQLEIGRLQNALNRFCETGYILRDVARPTPFAFPLLVDTLRQTVSSEKLEDRVKRMQLVLEKAADRS